MQEDKVRKALDSYDKVLGAVKHLWPHMVEYQFNNEHVYMLVGTLLRYTTSTLTDEGKDMVIEGVRLLMNVDAESLREKYKDELAAMEAITKCRS